MEREIFDVNNTLVQLTMVVRIQELQRTSLSTLRYDDLEAYLDAFLWKKGSPNTLSQAADDILHVTADDLVRFMSRQAITDGAGKSIADFEDML